MTDVLDVILWVAFVAGAFVIVAFLFCEAPTDGNVEVGSSVGRSMNIIATIHEEINEVSEHRAELWHRLWEESNPELVAQIKALDDKLDSLWNEHRAARSQIRFGERDDIVKRARAEERLERAA